MHAFQYEVPGLPVEPAICFLFEPGTREEQDHLVRQIIREVVELRRKQFLAGRRLGPAIYVLGPADARLKPSQTQRIVKAGAIYYDAQDLREWASGKIALNGRDIWEKSQIALRFRLDLDAREVANHLGLNPDATRSFAAAASAETAGAIERLETHYA